MRLSGGWLCAAVLILVVLVGLGLGEPQRSAGEAAPPCSRAAAKEVIREHPRLHPFAPLFTAAGPVLCGSFLGPGSNAMVVSFKAATCGGTAGWAVFRRHAGRWNMVWHQRNGQRSLAKVGTDIEETVNILRPSDPRCVPTGGTKSRVWHWSDSRFVAGAWVYLNPEWFTSPDKQVQCLLGEADAGCNAISESLGGPEHGAHLSRTGVVRLCSVETPSLYEQCFQQWVPNPPVLAYGQASELHGFRCTSAADGITCVKVLPPAVGKGFRVNKDEAVEVGGE